eukprot:TRINITY_DN5176_c0_g2_i1.p1 TRINITY_DN5176_c0_g2~~TRINITY_DN5176_c0_g2_i1.p1  ORF type:complete len:365 (+),score=57.93 TRINITY_DN5176_c0_g2_i1:1-1095(+)
MFESEGFLAGNEALPSAIRRKLDICVAEAHVAMSGYVDEIVSGLLSAEISHGGVADAATEIAEEAQEILSAKVVAAAQECLELAHRRIEESLDSMKQAQSLSSVNVVQVGQSALIGTFEHRFGKHADDLDSARVIIHSAMAQSVLRSQDVVETHSDRELCSVVPTVPPRMTHLQNRKLCSTSSTASAKSITSDDPPDTGIDTDAADESCASGSAGHPEICSRPCVRALIGQCELGLSCGFCHMPHEKSEVHFDRKQRTLLMKMTHEERVATIMPLVRLKLVQLQLDQDLLQDISHILETLQPLNYASDVVRSMRRRQRVQETRFTLRYLFAVIKKDTSADVPSELHVAVELLFINIKLALARRF